MRALFRLAPVLAVRVGESGIRYGFNCALALSLGVAGAGQMYVGLSVLALLATLARFGLDQAVFSQVAVARGGGRLPAARGVGLNIAAWALMAAVLLAVLLVLALPWVPEPLRPVLLRLAPGLPALALLTIAGSLLSALGRPVLGQVVGAILWPGLVLLFLALGQAAVGQVALATAGAMALAAAIGAALVWHGLAPGWAQRDAPPPAALARAAWPFFGVEMVALLTQNLPLIALGLWVSDHEAGLFGLASRIAMLVTILTMATYAVTAPRLARLHGAEDAAGFAQALHEATRGVVVLGLPVTLALLAVPAWVLGLFGPEFRAASPLLVVLVLAQVPNLLFSQCYTALAMAGQQRALLRAALAALLTMLLALAVLLPLWGSLGAALAMAAAAVVMGLGQAWAVRRYLGVQVLHAFRPRLFALAG